MSLMTSIINSVKMFTFSNRMPRLYIYMQYTLVVGHLCSSVYSTTVTAYTTDLSLLSLWQWHRWGGWIPLETPGAWSRTMILAWFCTYIVWCSYICVTEMSTKTNLLSTNVFFSSSSLWNDIPSELKNSDISRQGLKSSLKSWLFERAYS